jgi:signal transduction histidine kinase
LSPRNESLADLIQIVTLGCIVVLAAGGALAFWLARRALAPVERLRQQAAAISEVDAARSLDVPDTNDEVSRLASTLNDVLGRLRASMERERSFVMDAGHELRTPLALLAGEIELALDTTTDDAHRETLLRLQRDTQRLIVLAEDLLALSRAERGARRDVPLRSTVEAVVARIAPAATTTSTNVEVNIQDHLRVRVEPGQFERVIANLVENAHRHAATDIEISARHDAHHDLGAGVELVVRDFGEGFPEGFANVAIERFTRADPSRSGPGSGLGLAIVQTIVHAHGGTVRAANAHPGPGALVSVHVPD